MHQLVNDLAEALKGIDRSGEAFKRSRPGVGPYGEPRVVKKPIEYLREQYPARYEGAKTKRELDVLIPGHWALEFKIVRPFGDNGEPAEHWSQNLLHPCEGNVSAMGDALKLLTSALPERKGIIVLTYEHSPPLIDLEILVTSFELVSRNVLQIPLGPRCSAKLLQLVHPVHQQGVVYGWELSGPPIQDA